MNETRTVIGCSTEHAAGPVCCDLAMQCGPSRVQTLALQCALWHTLRKSMVISLVDLGVSAAWAGKPVGRVYCAVVFVHVLLLGLTARSVGFLWLSWRPRVKLCNLVINDYQSANAFFRSQSCFVSLKGSMVAYAVNLCSTTGSKFR